MSFIEVAFTRPTDEGFHFVPQCSPGKLRWYHGTSTYFSYQIENHGFLHSHEFITQDEKNIIKKFARFIPRYGAFACPVKHVVEDKLSITFAEEPRSSLNYAWGTLKGGIFRDLSHMLRQTSIPPEAKIATSEMAILNELGDRFSGIPEMTGVVYALELSEEDLSKLEDPGRTVRHLRNADITPDRITHKMIVPVDFRDR